MTLGQAAEREGRDEAARAMYETVLYSLREPAQAPLAGSLLRWIARSHLHQGNGETAAEIADTARLISELAGDTAGVAHAQNLGGNIERERGEIDRAAELYAAARVGAAAAGEGLLLAMIEQNEGVVAASRGEYRTALQRYRASLARHRALGRTAYLGQALNNLGMLCTDLRRWRAAERVFVEASAVCGECGDLATQARIAGNRVELWLKQGRWDDVRKACEETRRLAEAAGDTRTLGEVHKHLGVVHRETGDFPAAAAHLARAAEIAAERGDLALSAESAREQARLHWKRQEHRETLRALNQAHGLFSRLQARRELADVAAGLADLESLFLNIVAQWGQSIESADRYTQGHCERVASYACALAGAAGLDPDVLLWFRMGALLHDVGKIVVPPEVLNKPAALTPDERRLMQTHPDAGVELLE
ncbi:MAG TPA: HD domain-containing phosphohydrolase, partial [Longimicrobiaceae bacterium]|nr:HD domain-containing phosphohydrolase [Longimicrobiaceae bacterium]